MHETAAKNTCLPIRSRSFGARTLTLPAQLSSVSRAHASSMPVDQAQPLQSAGQRKQEVMKADKAVQGSSTSLFFAFDSLRLTSTHLPSSGPLRVGCHTKRSIYCECSTNILVLRPITGVQMPAKQTQSDGPTPSPRHTLRLNEFRYHPQHLSETFASPRNPSRT
ncbi:hypothetical protein FA95DRAFT_1605715 [Auriscalpium vulgare]|uniref:Uncharacterized protein n=1 Tax=Auriscalpium vulgare TaxID=40419 RepID=A0ACB8RV87_9AGAM|nr:hypothetical protein FA95DRAFT_1605715 [Auriscalpium vulgare]